ncbi:MAG: D-alanyl-D-alanine carboxypeptidase, partial [Firmicutes bacterium]|nr:D-alanyl-D-alanine carboxypeptidase [Bacillota bacterium]
MLILLMLLLLHATVFAETDARPELTAGAAIVMDAKTGQVLFEKNMNLQQYPASITKIMTGL